MTIPSTQAPPSALDQAMAILESLPDDTFTAPNKVSLAGAVALVSIADSLQQIAVSLDRIQRLGIGGRG